MVIREEQNGPMGGNSQLWTYNLATDKVVDQEMSGEIRQGLGKA
jgi:hypothetical protein